MVCHQGNEFPQWGPCLGQQLDCGDGGGPPDDGGNGGEVSLPPEGAPLCSIGGANDEPEILVGFMTVASKDGGLQVIENQTVSISGQVKVWINDECAPAIAPNETVDANTGAITPGNQNAPAGDGYLWEPAIYVGPKWAENGGMPYFAEHMKGTYDNDPMNFIWHCFGGTGATTTQPDPPPGPTSEALTLEVLWDVSSLGLQVGGPYALEVVIHDGDVDRGVGCIMLTITP